MSARGTSPARRLATCSLSRVSCARLGAAAFLGFTIKPNIYGSLAARCLGIPVINNISGWARCSRADGPAAPGSSTGCTRWRCARSPTVFFQNGRRPRAVRKRAWCRRIQAQLAARLGRRSRPIRRATQGASLDAADVPARRAAAVGQGRGRIRRGRATCSGRDAPTLHFQILGFIEGPNRAAVPQAQLDQWSGEGVDRISSGSPTTSAR